MTSESCESIRGRLLDLVAGDLPPGDEAWLRSHLAECRPCRFELEALEATVETFPKAADAAPPASVRDRVLRYAREPHAERRSAAGGGRRGQWLAVAGIVTALVTGLAIGVALQPAEQPDSTALAAPSFLASDVVTGESRSLSDYRGEVVLLNIWATWCRPCEVEMPSMERLHRMLGSEGLRVVAVSVDETGPEHVRDWAREHGITFDVLQDRSRRIEWQFQITGVPETIIIDRAGNIVDRRIGPALWDGPAETAWFRELIGME